MSQITRTILGGHLHKQIDEICPFKYHKDNQCAHFVSHLLGLDRGTTCKTASWANRTNTAIPHGANLRVDEIFSYCPERGLWTQRGAALNACLVFVTSAANVRGNWMAGVSQKHIGIHLDGTIWHYSNSRRRVETDSVDDWFAKFNRLYLAADITLFFGRFPS
jgi:hypothetical protein